MTGSHDSLFVVLSVLIAALASYAALDLAGRVRSAEGSTRLGWLGGGATVMGLGIWSMHFVAMLAFPRLRSSRCRSPSRSPAPSLPPRPYPPCGSARRRPRRPCPSPAHFARG